MNFQEVESIIIDDDDPEAIGHMLKWFYTRRHCDDSLRCQNAPKSFLLDSRVLFVARKYGVSELWNLIKDRMCQKPSNHRPFYEDPIPFITELELSRVTEARKHELYRVYVEALAESLLKQMSASIKFSKTITLCMKVFEKEPDVVIKVLKEETAKAKSQSTNQPPQQPPPKKRKSSQISGTIAANVQDPKHSKR